ncbi:hypothetical protein CCUN_0381 [Campylobacter cuniculorum DSM 23162 = LMG 24588]|uniref:Uncharacterized protein n=1 Tax=Campylobacter cuniculorum DSM 23162 = LMG 24588 TaxID=1121267 RepID=A0A1W6BVA0_9BACT|nr:hypothetical protein CCUN_0381 [Campylobacter cuniculorum DSM 23162 = LMG 24588]
MLGLNLKLKSILNSNFVLKPLKRVHLKALNLKKPCFASLLSSFAILGLGLTAFIYC